jgi:hypothetical protein
MAYRALSLNRNASTSFNLAPVDVLVLSKSTNTALPLLPVLLVPATTACSMTVPSLAIVVVVVVAAAAAVDCVFIAYASKFVSLVMLSPVLPSAPLLYSMSLSARLHINVRNSCVRWITDEFSALSVLKLAIRDTVSLQFCLLMTMAQRIVVSHFQAT